MEARRDVGYPPESPYFYRHLTGRELVRFYGRMCGMVRTELSARVAEVIDLVGMSAAADRRVGTYSKGMLQRIGLAQALVHDPRLLILDEPTAGVDPVGSAAMAELIVKLKGQGKTVLLTSHLLAQIEDICDRVAILDRGRLMLEGAVPDLVGRTGRQSLVMEALPPGELAELRAWLAARGKTSRRCSTARRLIRFSEQVGRGATTGRSHEARAVLVYRTRLIAQNTLLEASRQRLFSLLLFLASRWCRGRAGPGLQLRSPGGNSRRLWLWGHGVLWRRAHGDGGGATFSARLKIARR